MSFKQLVKNVIPPLLTEVVGRGHRSFIWQGIYDRRCDVPTTCDGYDDDRRISELIGDVRSALHLASINQFPGFARHTALGIVASMVYANERRAIILDFGGGAGTGFVHVLSTLKETASLGYIVVDLERICISAQRVFADDPRIQFSTSLDGIKRNADIVYASSVLPYIDNYPDLLRRLAALKAPYFLLGDLAAGDFPTYATKQLNLKGQVLAYWFLNITEVIHIVEACGYSCVYTAKCGRDYDQSNFPSTHRIGQMRNILFCRK